MATTNRTVKTPLIKQLQSLSSRFKRGKNDFLSVSGCIGFPAKTDSPRSIMNDHAMKQSLTLDKSQKAFVNTNFEDLYGNASTFYKTAKDNFTVLDIIKKFDQLDTDLQPYYIFIQYDSGLVDVLERKDVENLSERYGFQYVNDFLDSLKEGDYVKKDTVLAHPTSYDSYGNYGMGQNVLFAYQADAYTMEDSIQVIESFAKQFTSTDVDMIEITLNENNVLINRYGDDEHYKGWPDIGEQIQKRSAATVRIKNKQEQYFSFKSQNMHKKLSADKNYAGDGTVVDIEIYCNKPRAEIPNTLYNQQFLFYYDMIRRFRQRVADYTDELRLNFPCSQKVMDINKRMKDLSNPEAKIRNVVNKEFSFAVVQLITKHSVGIFTGQKITGRFGNKGVVSRVIPDWKAIHLRTGERVQMIINPLGVPNRLNIMQIFCQSITFRGRRILERMRQETSLKEKEKLLFTFIKIFNENEAEAVVENYKKLSSIQKKSFMEETEANGIFITVNPFWQDRELFDCIMECEETFPWIEPYETFFWNETSKRWVRQIARQPIGYMYMVKMKQTSKRGMSARATGPINQKGIPDKSHDAKKHMSLYANGAIKIGDQEHNIIGISVRPEIIAAENMLYRNSSIGRRKLGELQETSPLGIVDDFVFDEKISNRNVKALNARMLSMGLELAFEEDRIDLSDKPGIKEHIYKNYRYYCTTNEMKKIIATDIVKDEIENGDITVIGTDMQVNEFIDELSHRIASDVHFLYDRA